MCPFVPGCPCPAYLKLYDERVLREVISRYRKQARTLISEHPPFVRPAKVVGVEKNQRRKPLGPDTESGAS